MKTRVCLWFGVLLLPGVLGDGENFHGGDDANFNQTFFISEIFEKYGNNNVMTYEGFEHLLENLGLGKLKFETEHDVSIHKVNGTFKEFHDELSLHKHNHRTKPTEEGPRRKRYLKAKEHVKKAFGRRCLTAQDILATYGLEPYHEVVISPSKYLQMCPAIVYELDQKLCQGEVEVEPGQEERHLVWIYASCSVLAMGASGLLCVLAVPLIRKDNRSSLLQFLVSVAVGTLCGDALIHLLPQVFFTAEKEDASTVLISRGTVTLFAIYFFFIIENVIKGVREKRRKVAKEGKESGAMLPPLHGHSHGDKEDIKTVAWMAIMGDILHNVTDGLSIGAAFATSLSAGFASSIAIFCHELPHELGDYAILLASGMTVKKSLFYNFLSSIFSFLGMVAGVLLGEIKDASLWINAFTAGSFLYIALSDLEIQGGECPSETIWRILSIFTFIFLLLISLPAKWFTLIIFPLVVPELSAMQTTSNYKSSFVQSIGLACGGVLMLTIALYEDRIEMLLG